MLENLISEKQSWFTPDFCHKCPIYYDLLQCNFIMHTNKGVVIRLRMCRHSLPSDCFYTLASPFQISDFSFQITTTVQLIKLKYADLDEKIKDINCIKPSQTSFLLVSQSQSALEK